MEMDNTQPSDERDSPEPAPSRREILESFGSSYAPPSKTPVVIDDEEWADWANSIEVRVTRQNQIVIGLAAGLVITLGFTVLMGRVVIKLVEGQKVIVGHLNGVDSDGNPLPASASATAPRYSVPSHEVDTSKAAPVDEDLFADLKAKMDGSTQTNDLGEQLQ